MDNNSGRSDRSAVASYSRGRPVEARVLQAQQDKRSDAVRESYETGRIGDVTEQVTVLKGLDGGRFRTSCRTFHHVWCECVENKRCHEFFETSESGATERTDVLKGTAFSYVVYNLSLRFVF